MLGGLELSVLSKAVGSRCSSAIYPVECGYNEMKLLHVLRLSRVFGVRSTPGDLARPAQHAHQADLNALLTLLKMARGLLALGGIFSGSLSFIQVNI